MKTNRLVIAVLLLAVPGLVLAAPPAKNLLDAPVLAATCSTEPNEDNVTTLAWEAVTNAHKYSVDVTAGYDLDSDGCPDTYFDYSYDSFTTTLELDLDDLDYCATFSDIEPYDCIASFSAIDASFRVKALNPPSKGKNSAQNNPFSPSCQIISPEFCFPE